MSIEPVNPFTARLKSGVSTDGTIAIAPIQGPAPPSQIVPSKIGIESGHGLRLTTLAEVREAAQLLYDSKLVPQSFRSAEQITVALIRAVELNLPPFQAIEGMSVVNGRVGLMGDLALAIVENSGLLAKNTKKYIGEGDKLTCTITLQRKDREAQDYSFSVAEARTAGIYERSTVWKSYPRRMCYYRALGFGLRDEFSDILKGLKTVEELADYPTTNNKE